MEAKRTKQDNETEEDQDRISELPDEIVIDILSLLPTVDAVRTSVLSKRWRHMWTLVSTVDIYDIRDAACFRRCSGKRNCRKKVLNFIDECLKYPYANTTISKFKFGTKFMGDSGRIDEWLRFPVLQNVKELDLHLEAWATYVLPHPMLCLRALTVLNLCGDLALETPSPISLPSLKGLRLLCVGVDDQVLNNILLGCPALEKLSLYHCSRLLEPQVKSLSLKSMDFRNDSDSHCRSIEVEAANLQSFVYGGWQCRVNLARCPAIRNMLLKGVCFADPWLDDLVPQLPLLESLVFDRCYGLQRMKISNRHLKNILFILRRQLDLLEATIDAPSLVSFGYTGPSMIKISVDAPSLIDASITISDHSRKTYDTEWFVSLINFLSELNGCKNVHMFCSSKKALIIPDELREIYRSPLPDLKHMTVKTLGSALHRKIIFRKSLLWIAPSLETLSIV